MPDSRPNILFIMSDDHAAHAISAFGSVVNQTPNIDRIATEGARFDNVFCGNAICAPSRATILSGAARAFPRRFEWPRDRWRGYLRTHLRAIRR